MCTHARMFLVWLPCQNFLVYLPFECLNWAPVVCLWLKFMFMNVIMCELGWSGQSKGTYYAHVTDKFHKVVPGRCVMAVPGCISH